MTDSAVLKIEQRDIFERNVTRGLFAGLAAGVVAFVGQRISIPVPLTYVSLAFTAAAFARGPLSIRALNIGLAAILPMIPWFLGVTQTWKIGLAGAAAGAVMVRCLIAEKGAEGTVAAHRPGIAHYLATAVATGALAIGGSEVARIISIRLTDIQTPLLINAAVSGLILALFVSLGSIVSHVALKADPVAAKLEELIPNLSPEFAKQLEKIHALYSHCGKQLAEMPREPAREELAKTLQKVVSEAAELSSQWSGVEAQLQDDASTSLNEQIEELNVSASQARDSVAKQQLLAAAASLKDELGRLGEIKFKRERVLAKLKTHSALLERAKVALIGMRSSHATVRAAEMSAVARRLGALAIGQSDESKIAHEVATANEISAQESAALESQLTNQMTQAKMEVVTEVTDPLSNVSNASASTSRLKQ